jgi:hypothetical protein
LEKSDGRHHAKAILHFDNDSVKTLKRPAFNRDTVPDAEEWPGEGFNPGVRDAADGFDFILIYWRGNASKGDDTDHAGTDQHRQAVIDVEATKRVTRK